jgi:lipopolysaccharide cholinephosphotransferase
MKLNAKKISQEATSHVNNLRGLSQDEVKQLQMQLLEMLKDLISLCKEHEFCYMLVYGSALGVVRHGGFIPWDDDIDVGILRKDYLPFLNMFKKRFENKYTVGNIEEISRYHSSFRIQFKEIRGHFLYEVRNPLCTTFGGLFIDIFPIDNMPNNICKYKICGLFIDTIFHITNSVREYKHSTFDLRKYMSFNKSSGVYYRIKLIVGFLFSFISYKKWNYLYNKMVSSFHESEFLGIAIGGKKFSGNRFRRNVFIPTKIGVFEGENVSIPGDCHEYLRTMYGNYMKIPDINERERHFLIDIKA